MYQWIPPFQDVLIGVGVLGVIAAEGRQAERMHPGGNDDGGTAADISVGIHERGPQGAGAVAGIGAAEGVAGITGEAGRRVTQAVDGEGNG